jgi:protein SCO1/2
MTPRKPRLLAALVLAILLVAGAAVASVVLRGDDGEEAGYLGSPPPPGITLPGFELRDWTGELVDSRDLHDKVVLITFLDTQCTEACPIIAAQIGQALMLLGPDERVSVEALAITTDPEEDTPESIRAFLRRHRVEGTLRYLVGSEAELRPVWEAFDVLPSLDTGDDDVHSAPVRLFDRRGEWVATLHAGADLTPESLAHDVRVALEAS